MSRLQASSLVLALAASACNLADSANVYQGLALEGNEPVAVIVLRVA